MFVTVVFQPMVSRAINCAPFQWRGAGVLFQCLRIARYMSEKLSSRQRPALFQKNFETELPVWAGIATLEFCTPIRFLTFNGSRNRFVLVPEVKTISYLEKAEKSFCAGP